MNMKKNLILIGLLFISRITFAGMHNGHEYVDLGLPSRTLWATCNVGAAKPVDFGYYFAWGEIKPKQTYSIENYKWYGQEDEFGMIIEDYIIKYNTDSSKGNCDNKNTPDLEDDAARANWGGLWRMPTEIEIEELRKKCTWTWIRGKNSAGNEIAGYKITGTNGNSIFLPAAGYRINSSLYDAGSGGFYWSSSLTTVGPDYAYGLYFGSDDYDWSGYDRYDGRSVRAVFSKE